ncbi:MAG: GMC oxidoreductase [Tepidiformaceae bacterium]
MDLDGRTVPNGSALYFDVCIVGAGPAGLSIAKQLRGRGFAVCVLESGGTRRDERAQALGRGKNVGEPYFRLERTRMRMVGGSSNHWLDDEGYWSSYGGLRCRPLDACDLAVRAHVPGSGWPIGHAELTLYYERAHEALGLAPVEYSPGAWAEASAAPLAISDARVATTVCQFAARDVFQQAGQDLAADPGATLILYGTVAEMLTADDGDSVEALRVVTFAGNSFRLRARYFVLATGGIENARLLLSSSSARFPGGIGNTHGHVGRHFMEHVVVQSGLLTPASRTFFADLGFYRQRRVRGQAVIGALRVADETQRDEGLLNTIVAFQPHSALFTEAAVRSFGDLRWGLWERSRPNGIPRHLLNVARRPDQVLRASLVKVLRRPEPLEVARLVFTAEQAPNAASRVLLAEERDELGMRKVKLDWQLTPLDWSSLERTQEIVAEALAASKAGTVSRLLRDEALRPRVFGSRHHIGTTRMSRDARDGVVDGDCRVHGLGNLFVAGSSVFPTAGATTVTLSIVAMALRLADHVASLLAECVVVL